MPRSRLPFIAASIVILLCLLILFWSSTETYTHSPVSPESPLEISVNLPQDDGDQKAIDNRSDRAPQTSHIFLAIHYKNTSNRPLVLNTSEIFSPDLQFFCDSWFSKKRTDVFFTITGMMGGAYIGPGETMRQVADLKNYLRFAFPGIYRVHYTISANYDFYTGHDRGKSPATLVQDDTGRGTLHASASGSLNVPIDFSQSGWKY